MKSVWPPSHGDRRKQGKNILASIYRHVYSAIQTAELYIWSGSLYLRWGSSPKARFCSARGENSADSRLPVIFLRVAPHRGKLSRRHTKEEPTTNGRVVFAVRNQSYRLIALPLASGGYLLCILHKGVHIYITIFVQYMCTFIVEICVHIW